MWGARGVGSLLPGAYSVPPTNTTAQVHHLSLANTVTSTHILEYHRPPPADSSLWTTRVPTPLSKPTPPNRADRLNRPNKCEGTISIYRTRTRSNTRPVTAASLHVRTSDTCTGEVSRVGGSSAADRQRAAAGPSTALQDSTVPMQCYVLYIPRSSVSSSSGIER